MVSHVSEMYAAAFEQAVGGQDLDTEAIDRIVEMCADADIGPADLVALHCELGLQDAARHGYEEARYVAGMSLLQQVLKALSRGRVSDRKVVHDLRNSLQVISGTVSLLQRDLRQNDGRRAETIIERLKSSTQEMTRRLERL